MTVSAKCDPFISRMSMKVWKSSNSFLIILILALAFPPSLMGAVENLPRLRVDGHRIVSARAADADFDGGGQVDLSDFLLFAEAFGTTQVEYDLDESGSVDFADFLAFADVYGQNVDVVLRGVAVIDPFFLHASTRRGTEALNLLADEWNVDVIRVPIHPDLWDRYRDYLPAFVDPIVDWGKRRGVYIFLGWHAHGNPLTGQTEHPEWGYVHPWRGNPYNPDLSLAIEALDSIVRRYSDLPHVIYGTFNEPAFITWHEWRPVAESLVDVIHDVDPRALVLVSGIDWGTTSAAHWMTPWTGPTSCMRRILTRGRAKRGRAFSSTLIRPTLSSWVNGATVIRKIREESGRNTPCRWSTSARPAVSGGRRGSGTTSGRRRC